VQRVVSCRLYTEPKCLHSHTLEPWFPSVAAPGLRRPCSTERAERRVIVRPDVPTTNSIDYSAGESLSTAAIANQILNDQYTALPLPLLRRFILLGDASRHGGKNVISVDQRIIRLAPKTS